MAAPCCVESRPELIGDRLTRLKDKTWLLMCATYAMGELGGELTQQALAGAAAAIHDDLGDLEAELDRLGVK